MTVVKVALPRVGGDHPAARRLWKRPPSVTTPSAGIPEVGCSSTGCWYDLEVSLWPSNGSERTSPAPDCASGVPGDSGSGLAVNAAFDSDSPSKRQADPEATARGAAAAPLSSGQAWYADAVVVVPSHLCGLGM